MKLVPLALAASISLVAGVSHAQDPQSWTEIEDDELMVEPLGLTVGELDGYDVYDASGERIGEIDDILMGADGSSMAASLDVGGFLGLGEKDVTVPLSDLAKSGEGFMVDMSKEELEALPEFDG